MTDQPTSPPPPVDPRARTGERLWREVLGAELRARRSARAETLEVVARRANVSVQYLSEVERGMKEPSSEVVAAIGAALRTTLLDLTDSVAVRLRDERAATPTRGDVALAA